MWPKNADRMANSVALIRLLLEAVWSGSTLFAQSCLSENLGSIGVGSNEVLKVLEFFHVLKQLMSEKHSIRFYTSYTYKLYDNKWPTNYNLNAIPF